MAREDQERRMPSLLLRMRAVATGLALILGVVAATGYLAYSDLSNSVQVAQITDVDKDVSAGGDIGGSGNEQTVITRDVIPSASPSPKPTRTQAPGSPASPSSPAATPESQAPKSETVTISGGENIIVIGSDTRSGNSGKVGAGGADAVTGARSDVTMLIHIAQDRSKVQVISFPRDLNVDRPDCVGWDNDSVSYNGQAVPGEANVKLNSAYAVGGPRCLSKVISQVVTGSPAALRTNRFLAVDFAGFISVVDKIGGVNVCVNKAMQDRELGMILSRPGDHHLNGAKALSFARARKVIAESGSDYDRIVRQQYLVKQSLSKLMSSGTITKPEKIGDIISAVTDHMYGQNLTRDDMLGLVNTFRSIGMGNLSFHTVPTSGTENGNEMIAPVKAKSLFSDMVQVAGGDKSHESASARPKSGSAPDEDKGGSASLVPAKQAQPLLCDL